MMPPPDARTPTRSAWHDSDRRRSDRRDEDVRYRALIQALDQAYCIIDMIFDEAGRPVDYRFVEANDAFVDQTGLHDAIGKTVRQMTVGLEAHWFDIYGKIALSGEPARFTQHAQPLGRWYDVVAFRIGDAPSVRVGVLFRDVTERQLSEASLRESQARQAYLLALSDALRPLKHPTEIQAEAARVLGEKLGVSYAVYADVEHQDGVDYYVVSPNCGFGDLAALAGRYCANDYGAYLFEATRAGRTLLLSDISQDSRLSPQERESYAAKGVRAMVTVPLIKHERQVALVSVMHHAVRTWSAFDIDIIEQTAERTWSAVERAQAEQALLKSEEKLREADTRKDEFLATLAHELRNPLATIRTALHLISAGDTPEARKVEAMLERQVEHMVRLIDDLMEVSRISRGAIDLKRQTIDFSSAVYDALDAAQTSIERARHQLDVVVEPVAMPVHVDPMRLVQIVANLLSNAVRYTDPGGRIQVRGWRSGEVCHLSVADSGIGIPAEKLASVFTMFGQIDRHDARSQGGLGIGLALAQRLARMHGGDIDVRSAGAGQGSTFTLHLPVAWSEPAPPRQAQASRLPATSRRVLVVDDNQDSAEATGMLLHSFGAEVKVLNGGVQALALLEHWQPEIALLDIGMPGMDGHELAQRIRQLPQARDVYLVALSGWGQEADIQRTRDCGFDLHLVKPASADQLLSLLTGPLA